MPAALHPTRAADVSDNSLLAQIGNTPLVFLERISAAAPGVKIFVKDESRNPGGSVKDRPALNMVLDGERKGLLTPDKIILDSTSGNTGIAYAMIGAARGYKVKLCLPANASLERKRILKAYGAEVILTDPAEGSDGAIRKCRDVYQANPSATFILTNTTIRPTGKRTSRPRASRFWSKPKAGSHILLRRWVPAERAWV